MKEIRLPKLLESKLKSTPLLAPIISAIDRCNTFFGDPGRGLPFFPEFTDHGPDHIQGVFNAAVALLNPASRKHFAAEDAVVLSIGVLLHDAGMHLTPDIFLALIEPSFKGPMIPELDSKCWHDEWSIFLAEASRWDSRRLFAVMGDATGGRQSNSADLARFVRSPREMGSPDLWPITYRKFLGEFIRRHHPRMAHEFALQRLPGPSDDRSLQLVTDLDRALIDLGGFVARSHGMSLRSTFNYLRSRYHAVAKCRNTHPVFLMVLLRIADYLQVESGRAPSAFLKVRTLRNPISIDEWSIHQSIDDVLNDEKDAESINVIASPKSAAIFLKVRALLDGLQRELDLSWAVLGEVYSLQQGGLKNLGIRLRRVRSNLDDLRAFRKQVSYVPGRFAFEAAGTGLLKKLIKPLYGDCPEVGVRELLQNAIDAVNEFRAMTPDANSLGLAHIAKPEITVQVNKTPEGGVVIVEDYGVGMTESTVRDYFLRVGASFRDSDAWRQEFALGGQPKVVRSGRFGIGCLASFLLGDRVEVLTRHTSTPPDGAVSFSASIDDDVIELRKASRARPGTTITVPIGEKMFTDLSAVEGKKWDWYRLNEPEVRRTINEEPLPRLTRLPTPGAMLDPEWHRLIVSGFDEVLWTYSRAPRLVCNGLNVGSNATDLGPDRLVDWGGKRGPHQLYMPLTMPSIAVVDRSAYLPLDLQRYGLAAERYPFTEELLADVTRDFCAHTLVTAIGRGPWETSNTGVHLGQYPGLTSFYTQPAIYLCPWFFAEKGSGLAHWDSLRRVESSLTIAVLGTHSKNPFIVGLRPDFGQLLFAGNLRLDFAPDSSLEQGLGYLFGRQHRNLGPHPFFFTQRKHTVVLMSVDLSNRALAIRNGYVDLRNIGVHPLSGANGIHVWFDGDQSFVPWGQLSPLLPAIAKSGLVVGILDKPSIAQKPASAFSEIWADLMPQSIIPFDKASRQSQFSATYEKIGPLLENWEKLIALNPAEFANKFLKGNSRGERDFY